MTDVSLWTPGTWGKGLAIDDGQILATWNTGTQSMLSGTPHHAQMATNMGVDYSAFIDGYRNGTIHLLQIDPEGGTWDCGAGKALPEWVWQKGSAQGLKLPTKGRSDWRFGGKDHRKLDYWWRRKKPIRMAEATILAEYAGAAGMTHDECEDFLNEHKDDVRSDFMDFKQKFFKKFDAMRKGSNVPFVNGGHKIVNYLGNGQDFETVPWTPGKRGKGMLVGDTLHMWATHTPDKGYTPGSNNYEYGETYPDPHHDGIWEAVAGPEPGLDNHGEWRAWMDGYMNAPKFYINHDGSVGDYRMKNQINFDWQTIEELVNHHPDLYMADARQQDKWTFGKTAVYKTQRGLRLINGEEVWWDAMDGFHVDYMHKNNIHPDEVRDYLARYDDGGEDDLNMYKDFYRRVYDEAKSEWKFANVSSDWVFQGVQ